MKSDDHTMCTSSLDRFQNQTINKRRAREERKRGAESRNQNNNNNEV